MTVFRCFQMHLKSHDCRCVRRRLRTLVCHVAEPFLHIIVNRPKGWALFSSQKVLQNFSDFSSHRIFRRMHGVLNIDKNKN
jgi:hypothetical protein